LSEKDKPWAPGHDEEEQTGVDQPEASDAADETSESPATKPDSPESGAEEDRAPEGPQDSPAVPWEPAAEKSKEAEPERSSNSGGGQGGGDGFQPFYHQEARRGSAVRGVLYLLFALLSLGFIALTVDVLVEGTDFRLEAAVIGLIWLALQVLLRKSISLEVKVGLSALALALLYTVAVTLYQGTLGFFGLVDSDLIVNGFYVLVLLAAVVSVWRLWGRFHWLPLVLTLIFVYAALAPIWPLVVPGGEPGRTMLTGPGFADQLPIFVRPGWLMVQVILPLAAVFMLILQVRALTKPQFVSHWGYFFWAASLVLVAAMGLAGLQRMDRPVFPRVATLAESVYPAAAKVAKAPEPAPEPAPAPEPKPEPAPEPQPAEPAKTAESAEPAEPAQADESAEEMVTAKTAKEASAKDAASETKPEPAETEAKPEPPAPSVDDQEEGPAPPQPGWPSKAETPAAAPQSEPKIGHEAAKPQEPQPAPRPAPAGLDDLKKRVDRLERELIRVNGQLQAQDALIRSLMMYLASQATPTAPPSPPALTAPMPQPAPTQEPAMEDQPAEEPAPASEPTATEKPVKKQAPAEEPAPTQEPAVEDQPAEEPTPASEPAATEKPVKKQAPAEEPAPTEEPTIQPIAPLPSGKDRPTDRLLRPSVKPRPKETDPAETSGAASTTETESEAKPEKPAEAASAPDTESEVKPEEPAEAEPDSGAAATN
jgi:hypothetical protein